MLCYENTQAALWRGPDGVQGRPLQNVPLWHVDYFELKTDNVQQTQEELFNPPLTPYKNLHRSPGPRRYLQRVWLRCGELGGWEGMSAGPVCSKPSACPIVSAGMTNICLPNICFSYLPVNCLPPLFSPRSLPPSP